MERIQNAGVWQRKEGYIEIGWLEKGRFGTRRAQGYEDVVACL